MEDRLQYLLDLQKHCKKTDQRFTGANARELAELLTAYHAKHLSSYGEHQS